MVTIDHNTKDTCKHCGREIYYDAYDGYWDSQFDLKTWTPLCNHNDFIVDTTNRVDDKWHEPINYRRDRDTGHYIK